MALLRRKSVPLLTHPVMATPGPPSTASVRDELMSPALNEPGNATLAWAFAASSAPLTLEV